MISSVRVSVTLLLMFLALSHPGPAKAQPVEDAFGASEATLQDYWAGKATWTYLRNWNEVFDSSHIEVLGNTWYLFQRYVHAGTGCPWGGGLGTQVRQSTDKGATWSAPVTVIAPTPGTPWGCAATDGDAIYDSRNNKWRYLYQCIPSDLSSWAGCYAERAGTDPMGPFTPVGLNPSVASRSLWGLICNSPTDQCSTLAGGPGRVFDEGTFNIFRFDGTYYWVAFHGYDGIRGYRGMAKTPDFVNWVAGSPSDGLPNDSFFDLLDTVSWRESWETGSGPIGGGAGSILKEGDYYYQAIEAADVNLGCTPGQHWDIGLLRTSTLEDPQWEQFPFGNPIVYSTRVPDWPGGLIPPCAVQYVQLFSDPTDDAVYMKFARVSGDPSIRRSYLYKLTKSSNVLRNADLWMADASHWQIFPIGPTNMVVYRDPANASDYGQYLATNCGTNPQSCIAGQSFYQDVPIAGSSGKWASFGGKFKTSGGNGTLVLQLHELGAANNLIATRSLPIAATPSYQHAEALAVPLSPNTAKLRYQGYLHTSTVTFNADEMFANVTPSAASCALGTSWAQLAAGIGHVVGRVDGDGWSATPSLDAFGYLQFGPYTTTVPAGNHAAKWKLAIDSLAGSGDSIVRLDVYDATAHQVLASRDVVRSDWTSAGNYNCFALPFTLDPPRIGHQLEFRVLWYDRAYVKGGLLGYD